MSYDTIARRWALAIFELGKDASALARLNTDINAFADAYAGSPELKAVLDNPLVAHEAREAIIGEVAQRMALTDVAKSTLRLLARKRRLAALPAIARRLARLTDDDQGLVRAEVTSAGPLSEEYLGKLRGELEKATGKKVVVAHKLDKSLIGGVVTRLGDRVIDGSVKTRLATFRESLLRT
jgi:F-type H+-transporting ATPase subunit delta